MGYREIENPMVLDRIWQHFEKKQRVIETCAGCGDEILEGEDVFEFQDIDGETVLVHMDLECCYQYVGGMSHCKVAGE